ncbi:MAG: hypothetical protein AAAC47_04050, partial [Pararhizobium sp.]
GGGATMCLLRGLTTADAAVVLAVRADKTIFSSGSSYRHSEDKEFSKSRGMLVATSVAFPGLKPAIVA